MSNKYTWARFGGYEVSTKGDPRFSALVARMPDNRTVECWYQCDVKGYDPFGVNWRLGKGKPPLHGMSPDIQWDLYLSIWKLWAIQNPNAVADLMEKLNGSTVFSDRFASSSINQARAWATIFNDWGL